MMPLLALASAMALLAKVAFVATPGPVHRVSERAVAMPVSQPAEPQVTESSALVAAGVWTLALASTQLTRRVARRPEGPTETPAPVEEKKAFSISDPSTYGNISMDDVKKYGAAGTVAYFVTELIFWAVAFPTECFIYLQTAGHWPDFQNPTDSATVLGFVFAASNVARVLVPIRFGAALALAPWVDENIMTRLPGRNQA